MARARPVPGIRPKEDLRTNARRVVAVRLEELLSWRGSLEDSSRVQDLHDMRIASKRLRYALEMFDVCFHVKGVLKETTSIQEDIGVIHDLDVLVDILRTRLERNDAMTAEEAVTVMGSGGSWTEKSNALRRLLYAQARDRRRLGLIGLMAEKVGERRRLYEDFRARWSGDALDAFAQRVRAVAELLPDGAQSPSDVDGREKVVHHGPKTDAAYVQGE